MIRLGDAARERAERALTWALMYRVDAPARVATYLVRALSAGRTAEASAAEIGLSRETTAKALCVYTSALEEHVRVLRYWASFEDGHRAARRLREARELEQHLAGLAPAQEAA